MVDAADQVIADQKKQVEIRDLRIKTIEDRLDVVQKQNDQLRAEDSSLIKNPAFLLLLGAVLGAYAVRH